MKKITQMKISTAVADYKKMFPEDYRLDLEEIKWKRDNLKSRMAEIKGTHAVQRELFAIGTKLDTMINLKLTDEEKADLSTKESARWFTKTFPEFKITDEI